ncbi:ATP-binding protein [Cupriavidus sp. AU9028]|uniref:ATP-binding protein n=1 Tax=Cupriavidus sp. AU9028 TaxID=2871157 RepID=UPI00351CE1F8
MTASAVPTLDVLSALREATGERHHVLDKAMPLARSNPGLTEYRDHLLLLRLWLEPLESWLRRFDDGPQAPSLLPHRWRLALIDADLADPAMPAGVLPAEVERRAASWMPLAAEPAYRWGLCYVIEGSQLGGALLYRNLSEALHPHPLRYLRGDGPPGPRWQQFLHALRDQVRTPEEVALACRGAQDAFDRLLRLIDDGTEPVPVVPHASVPGEPVQILDHSLTTVHDEAAERQAAALVFDVLPEAHLIVDAHDRVVLANHRYLELVGATLDAIRGRSVYDINQQVPEGQRAARRAWVENTLRTINRGERRQSPVLRYDLPKPDEDGNGEGEGQPARTERYWQARAVRVPSPGPLTVGEGRRELAGRGTDLVIFTLSDVTDTVADTERSQRERAKLRSQAQLRQVLIDEANAELRSQQQRLQEVLSFARVGAWEWDLSSGVLNCTDQCYRNLGLSLGEPVTEQRLFGDLIEPEDRQRVRSVIEGAIEQGRYFEVEYRVNWPDGSVRWLLARGAPRTSTGGSQSLVGFTLDVTERKLVELRHLAMAQEEKHARERSEETTRAMDHFIAAVSHELRSPLHAILSWTALLQRAADASLVDRAVTVIERNARQLSLMVDDLLDSGAIVTGKLSVDLQPIDLGALAGIVAEDIRVNAEARGITLVAQTLASCIVLGDESRLKQVIWNLLTNAVKFSEGGTVQIAVTASEEHAELTVRDTGAGIAPEDLDRIFERFEQARGGAPVRRSSGLGLGLWLVKSLVALHGGTVSAHSDGPGKGATFRVRLPRFR